MRLIDADALWNALNDAGGTGAERGGWADGWCKAIDAAIRMLEKAPTVEPEPQWIPVTERLPEHYRNEDGTLIPFIVCIRNWKNPVVAYYNGQIWGDMGMMDAVAWAPTPEPYNPEWAEDTE